MRKTLLPMVASLLLCGTATAALIATNAKAGPTAAHASAPVMVALAGAPDLAAEAAAPDAGAPPAGAKDMAARRAAMCGEIPARAAGRLAYLQVRLDLTAAQTPLFERWKNVRLAAARRMQAQCAAGPKTNRGMRAQAASPVERLAREEDMLKARLADIGAERPALTALYASLTDAQKANFGRGRDMAMMMRPGSMKGPMGGRMDGMRQMMPPPPPAGPGAGSGGPPADAPPPPPPQ